MMRAGAAAAHSSSTGSTAAAPEAKGKGEELRTHAADTSLPPRVRAACLLHLQQLYGGDGASLLPQGIFGVRSAAAEVAEAGDGDADADADDERSACLSLCTGCLADANGGVVVSRAAFRLLARVHPRRVTMGAASAEVVLSHLSSEQPRARQAAVLAVKELATGRGVRPPQAVVEGCWRCLGDGSPAVRLAAAALAATLGRLAVAPGKQLAQAVRPSTHTPPPPPPRRSRRGCRYIQMYTPR
jgi:hypothetical protein